MALAFVIEDVIAAAIGIGSDTGAFFDGDVIVFLRLLEGHEDAHLADRALPDLRRGGLDQLAAFVPGRDDAVGKVRVDAGNGGDEVALLGGGDLGELHLAGDAALDDVVLGVGHRVPGQLHTAESGQGVDIFRYGEGGDGLGRGRGCRLGCRLSCGRRCKGNGLAHGRQHQYSNQYADNSFHVSRPASLE